MTSGVDTYKGEPVAEAEYEVIDASPIVPPETLPEPLSMDNHELVPVDNEKPVEETQEPEIKDIEPISEAEPVDDDSESGVQSLAEYEYQPEIADDPNDGLRLDDERNDRNDGLNLDDSDIVAAYAAVPESVPDCARCGESLTNPNNRHWYQDEVYGKDCAAQVASGATMTNYQRQQQQQTQQQPLDLDDEWRNHSREQNAQPHPMRSERQHSEPVQRHLATASSARENYRDQACQAMSRYQRPSPPSPQSSGDGANTGCGCSDGEGIQIYINDNHGVININSG